MSATDAGYPQVLRRVVADFAPVVVGSDPRLAGLRAARSPKAVVAASADSIGEAWAHARALGLPSVHVVMAASPHDVRGSARAALAARGWVLLGVTRVMWPASDNVPGAGSRQQRIDRDTRDVIAEVVPAGADAVGPLAEALDRALAEVDTLLDLAGQPQPRAGDPPADEARTGERGEPAVRGVRRLLARRRS